MDLVNAKLIPDTRLFGVVGVSKECGRRTIDQLEADGAVAPLRTPTGRRMLSFREAEAVLRAFPRVAA